MAPRPGRRARGLRNRGAAAAGVSKGGCSTTSAAPLRDGLVSRALADTNVALQQPAAEGSAARTRLRLSVLDEDQRQLWAGLLATVWLVGSDAGLPPQLAEHIERWQRLLGDPTRAKVVRLVGDGLLLHGSPAPRPTRRPWRP